MYKSNLKFIKYSRKGANAPVQKRINPNNERFALKTIFNFFVLKFFLSIFFLIFILFNCYFETLFQNFSI